MGVLRGSVGCYSNDCSYDSPDDSSDGYHDDSPDGYSDRYPEGFC